ncbi:hypothetical protein A8C32_11690 [Flavivirga aquatica]|uniref:Uncharacterized protein n=2 Tax=Flavivirga aquatica TaxID=1849968 RepID=A0A1E5TDC9_9FLAO|nr:hypothetical protein A8C32_11690 [Flavivirga aquatica]
MESNILFNKYEKATIHFLDGTSVKGYGKIVEILKIYKIKFKASLEGKPDVWTDLIVKGITFNKTYEDDITFSYIKIQHRKTPRLLKVVEQGVISLYVEIRSHFVVDGYTVLDQKMEPPIRVTSGHRETFNRYYAKKEGDLEAIDFLGVVNFKKSVKKYFSDCEGVIQKLNKKEFNIDTIPDIVYYYNDFCVD